MAQTRRKQRETPCVVKFASKNFKIDEKNEKWSADCRHCNGEFEEALGTTSGFIR